MMTTMTTVLPRFGRVGLRTGIVLIVAAAFFTSACSDGPTAPKAGGIRVTITTTGGDLDLDGYQVVVDAEAPVSVQPNSIAVFRDLAAIAHTVDLNGIADNCSIVGAHPLTVTVPAGDTVLVAINVVCDATGVRATTQTTGQDKPIQFQVKVGDHAPGALLLNGEFVLSRLSPGSYTVELIGLPQNCTVATNPLTVEVSSRSLAAAVFQIVCTTIPRTGRIAFVRSETNGAWIALANADGSNEVSFVKGSSPTWSPDGTALLFSNRDCDYYSYYCTGGILSLDAQTGSTQPTPYVGSFPAWSPDGVHVAFVNDYGQLMVGRADGVGGAVQLTIPSVGGAYDPTWSPDSQRIAFTCYSLLGSTFRSDICVVNSDGTNLHFVTNDSPSDGSPAWSPDGTTIAFATYRFNTTVSEVATINVAGGSITRVVRGFTPEWSPAGTLLVVADLDGLFTCLPDGSNVQRVATGQTSYPVWHQ